MINKGGIILFILYIIFYMVFSIIFDMKNIFGYFLHLLLLVIPSYILYTCWKEKNKINFWIILWILVIFIIYIFQYNYLKIQEFPDKFLSNKFIDYKAFSKDCELQKCTNLEMIEYLQNLIDGKISLKDFDKIYDIILKSDKDILKSIIFEKNKIFENFIYYFIYYEKPLNEKSGIDLVFNEKELLEYKKWYSYLIYEKYINGNEIKKELDKYIMNKKGFIQDFYSKNYYYKRMIYQESVFGIIWKRLWKMEEKINNAKK